MSTAATREDFDIDARMAEVVGEAPRIEPLGAEEMDEESRELVRAIRASAGAADVNQLPEFMRTMIKHPALFRLQMEMGNMLYNGKIPQRERELAILRNAWICRAPFEWGQHVIIAHRIGITGDEIERARIGSAAGGWSRHEGAVIKAVEELHGNTAISQETWDLLAETWDEPQLIEFCQMIGQYVTTAFVQNSIRARLEDGNAGLTQR
ncbi:MAG: carboxymuconolactone decarboxylase family protein [Novosphingobium sp.]|nr:carboxymuconolactone decarboxylase family protein [Novosphingobium sp.]